MNNIMKLIDAKGNRVNLKEKEKVISEPMVGEKEAENQNIWQEPELQYLADEDYQLDENMCNVLFLCKVNNHKECLHFMQLKGVINPFCKYIGLESECTSAIVQAQACVKALKKLGFKYVKLEG